MPLSYLSHSQLGKMDHCPEAYRLYYEANVTTKKKALPLVLGGVVDTVVTTAMNALRRGTPMDADQMAGLFAESWAAAGLDNPQAPIDWGKKDPVDEKATALLLCRQVPVYIYPYVKRVAMTQAKMRVPVIIGGKQDEFMIIPDLMGDLYPPVECFDCRDKLAAARAKADAGSKMSYPECPTCCGTGMIPDTAAKAVPVVVDFKTAASRWGKTAAAADGQVKEYLWALSRSAVWQDRRLDISTGWKTPPDQGMYLIGLKQKKGGWMAMPTSFTAFDAQDVEARIAAHVLIRDSGLRPRRPGYGGRNCDFCDYPTACWEPERAHEVLNFPRS